MSEGSQPHTCVVTRYETYASFVPSFSFRGVSTAQSSLPSPMPARSTSSAFGPAWTDPWLPIFLPEELVLYSLSSRSVEGAVFGRDPTSVSVSFCQDTLSKSLSMGTECESQALEMMPAASSKQQSAIPDALKTTRMPISCFKLARQVFICFWETKLVVVVVF